MTTEPRVPRFSHHAFAVFGAVMLGATILSLGTGMIFMIDPGVRMQGAPVILTLTAFIWLAIFIVAMPGAGIAFSLLWPITRRMTTEAKAICVLAGVTTGIVFASTANLQHHVTVKELGFFMLAGATIAVIYLVIVDRITGEPKRSKADSRQLKFKGF
jgi:hypothetical protein